ncbi:MAG: rRNA maturation RNase YbeY [Parachlamydiales bacterium]
MIIENRQTDLSLSEAGAGPIAQSVVADEGKEPQEVGIHFVDATEMSQLHMEYFQDPSLTDCISLPVDGELLGDVFVCPKQALLYTQEHGGDPYWETTLYLVHGLLHLLGYDDKEEGREREMREAERRHMERLQTAGRLLTP